MQLCRTFNIFPTVSHMFRYAFIAFRIAIISRIPGSLFPRPISETVSPKRTAAVFARAYGCKIFAHFF